MGAIKLATSASTDEEYGGTTGISSCIVLDTLNANDFEWDSVMMGFVSKKTVSEIVGNSTFVGVICNAINGNAIVNARIQPSTNKIVVLGIQATSNYNLITSAYQIKVIVLVR